MWNKSPSSQSRASRNARLCQSVFRFAPHRQPQTRRAESLRYTSLPVYVGPRRSGQSLPPVPSPQVSAESAEPFGLVILAGSNLLRLHFRQRLPSAGPTHPCEGQSNCALFPGQCRAGKTVIHRISVRASGSCRGLRPCPLCHLCPATATAAAVAASGPKQHRPSDERPLQPRCEIQRHHPRKGNCRIYIFIYSLGVVDNYIWKVYSNGDSECQIFPSIIHRYSLIITCLYQNYLLNSPILSEMLKD